MRVRRQLAIPLIVFLVFAFGVSPTAVIAKSSNYPILGSVILETLPILDVANIARDLEISENQVIHDYGGQEEFLLAVSNAYTDYGDIFFSSGWTPEHLHSEGYKAWVSFSEKIPLELVKIFSDLPIPVQIRTDAPASADELEIIREKVINTLYGALDGIIGITGDFSEFGELYIQYELNSSMSKETDITIAKILSEFKKDSIVEIIAEQKEEIAATEELVKGGVAFDDCTLGFTATHGGQNGGVTAGHCTNVSKTPYGSSTSMPYINEHKGAYGDAQFHSTTESISASVATKSNGGNTRIIRGTFWPSNGMVVCNYGKTRDTDSCTTIKNWNHAFMANLNGENVYLSRMAQSNGTFTNGGDSGGPWYSGEYAVGVHFGKSGGYSTMSRVRDVEAILGIYIYRV